MGVVPGCKWSVEDPLFLLLAEGAAVPLRQPQPGRGRAAVRGLARGSGPLLPQLKNALEGLPCTETLYELSE